jgi:pyruvyltransferase
VIRLYRWPERNFGDALSVLVTQAVTDSEVVVVDDPADADLVAAGSILQQLAGTGFAGAVWGTGLIADTFGVIRLPDARVAAVRGCLTRRHLDVPDTIPLGDPGLLANLLVDPRPPDYAVGIVPHKVDRDVAVLSAVAAASSLITVIDVTEDPSQVLAEIASCRSILSSSLHGLVVADALGIPSAWIQLSDRVIGGGFKFRDYYSALGRDDVRPVPFAPGDDVTSLQERTVRADPARVEALRDGLLDAFPIR